MSMFEESVSFICKVYDQVRLCSTHISIFLLSRWPWFGVKHIILFLNDLEFQAQDKLALKSLSEFIFNLGVVVIL